MIHEEIYYSDVFFFCKLVPWHNLLDVEFINSMSRSSTILQNFEFVNILGISFLLFYQYFSHLRFQIIINLNRKVFIIWIKIMLKKTILIHQCQQWCLLSTPYWHIGQLLRTQEAQLSHGSAHFSSPSFRHYITISTKP